MIKIYSYSRIIVHVLETNSKNNKNWHVLHGLKALILSWDERVCSLFREFRVLYYNPSCLQLFPHWNHLKIDSRQHSSLALEADGAIPSVHSAATEFSATYERCLGIQLI